MTGELKTGANALVVAGAGVVGLTTAITLLESGYPVTVLSAQMPAQTTSAVAGATWFPYKVSPRQRVTRWTAASRRAFDDLTHDPRSGVTIRQCVQLWRDTVERNPWWATAVPDLGRLPASQLPPGFADSYVFSQPVIDMRRYLPYLLRRFTSLGGKTCVTTLGSLEEASRIGDIVVNCTGLGARMLAGDGELYPVRGHCVRVRNPGIGQVIADFDNPAGEAYVIPHDDSCVLGGTAGEHDWDTTPDPAVSAQIHARCTELDQRLARAEFLDHAVGLRPARISGVRLDAAPLQNGTPCVHNYGHGGAGVTLSWGCAAEVLDLVNAALSS